MSEDAMPGAAGISEEAAALIAVLGRELWGATLIGNAPPAIVRLRDRMLCPQQGDLVIEISRFGAADPDGTGRLVRTEGDPEREGRWIIDPLTRPGTEMSWANAQFIALPDKRGWLKA